MALILADVLDRAGDSLGESLPRLAGAIVLLLIGLLAAWLIGRLTTRTLAAVGVDELGERFAIHDVLDRVGLDRSLSRLLGRAVRVTLTIVILIASFSLLGLAVLSDSLNEVVLFLPKLLVALALILLGVVVADFVRDRVVAHADQMGVGGPLGRAVQLVIIALAVLTALAQLGIPTTILTAVVGIGAIGAALTLALAFGLGSREVARQVSAGRYIGGAFELGQTISIDGARGEIVALESAVTVLRTEEGRTVRVPNHLLLESIVTVHEASEEPV